MELLSINIGMPKPVDMNGEMVTTGICKTPVDGPMMLRADGLEGDGVGNTKSHGGPDQAVFAYASEHYDHWSKTYGRDDLAFGLMGENLTVRGWVDEDVLGATRDEFLAALEAEGVPARPWYPHPLYANPIYKTAPYRKVACPVAEQACKDSFWLPQRVLMGSDSDTADITKAIDKIYQTYKPETTSVQ